MVIGHMLTAGGLAFETLEYNRDGFLSAASLHQNQMYQEKNYHINLIAALREEVRDFMTIFVGRMSNNMIMDTLFFGIAAGFLCEGEIDDSAADFLVHAYYTCMVVSVLYFLVSLIFAVLGVTLAYAESRQFLLRVVPDPLDKYDFDYMNQMKDFERDSQAYRVPILSNFVNPNRKKGKSSKSGLSIDELPRGSKGSRQPKNEGLSERARVPSASSVAQQPRSYFEVLGEYNSLWEPCSTASHECMAHGIGILFQGFAMFALGHEYDRSHWGAVNLFVTLTAAGLLVSYQQMKVQHKQESNLILSWLIRILTVSAPLMFLVGDLSNNVLIVASSFFMTGTLHLLFALMTILSPREEPKARSTQYEVDAQDSDDLEVGRESPEPMLQDLLRKSRKHSRRNTREATRIIATGHLLAAAPWFSLFIWIALRYVQSPQPAMIDVSTVKELPIQWPTSHFHAHALSCSGDGEHLWLANKLGVYRISGGLQGGSLQPLPCPSLSGHLRDMAAACQSESRCSLLALTTHNLMNCETNETYAWSRPLQVDDKITSVSFGSGMDDLYYFDGSEIIHDKDQFEMPVPREKMLHKFEVLPSASGPSFYFFSKDGEIEMQEESSGKSKTWQVPKVATETLRGACLLDEGNAALVALQDASPTPRLLRVPLN